MTNRAIRIAEYTDWVKRDVAYLMDELSRPHVDDAVLLVDARRELRGALELIEHRLGVNKMEPTA